MRCAVCRTSLSGAQRQFCSQRCKHYAQARRVKLEVLTHYSPSSILRCSWEGCTITDIDMLTLDHLYDNGNHQTNRSGERVTGWRLYRWAKRHGYPDTLQTLCGSHQLKKRFLDLKRIQPWAE